MSIKKYSLTSAISYCEMSFKIVLKKKIYERRVSVQGFESLWGDCRFIPADLGLYSMICSFCSFWRLFTRRMIKSAIVFPFSFWKRNLLSFILLHKTCKMAAKWFNSLDTNSSMRSRSSNLVLAIISPLIAIILIASNFTQGGIHQLCWPNFTKIFTTYLPRVRLLRLGTFYIHNIQPLVFVIQRGVSTDHLPTSSCPRC